MKTRRPLSAGLALLLLAAPAARAIDTTSAPAGRVVVIPFVPITTQTAEHVFDRVASVIPPTPPVPVLAEKAAALSQPLFVPLPPDMLLPAPLSPELPPPPFGTPYDSELVAETPLPGQEDDFALPPGAAALNGLAIPVNVEPPGTCAIAPEEEGDDDDDDEATPQGETAAADGEEGSEAESELPSDVQPNAQGYRYSADVSDSDLEKLWKEKREALGTVSVGFTDAGRLINGIQFPEGDAWTLTCPDKTYGTQETIDYLTEVLKSVDEQFPGGPPMRINGISKKEGGYARPHRSHQNGRDVDLGFYYRLGMPGPRVRDRAPYMDLERNWALIRTLVIKSDVQMILVDKRIQKVLYNYALSIGEDKDWLDSLFHAGANSLIKHARRHRDHFHVRFFNPRAQELGRRIQPLLAKDPEAKHIVTHRVRRGDSIGRIARKYGTTVKAIRLANGMRSSSLRAGRTLVIPVRGACTNCPLPPPVVVPPRRLPPEKKPLLLGSRMGEQR